MLFRFIEPIAGCLKTSAELAFIKTTIKRWLVLWSEDVVQNEVYGEKVPVDLSEPAAFRKRMKVADIGEFTTTNEELCRYAEAAAVLGQKVAVTFSDFFGGAESLSKGDLYHIRMIPKGHLPAMGI